MTNELATLEKEVHQTEEVLEPMKVVTIRSAKDLEMATAMLGDINFEKKRLTTLKETMTKPLNEALKNIRGLFSPAEDKIAEVDKLVRGKIMEWNRKVTEANAVKEAETLAKVESGEMSVEAAGNKLEKLEDKKAAIPTRKIKVVVVDDESKIPQKYWVVDMVMVRREALAGVEIAGVRVEEQETVVAPR